MRSLIDSRTEPDSHVRESLEAWHHGLLNNYRPPILKPPQFLDIDEVLQVLPEQASASNFVELPYAPLDTVQHRSWSALQADKRLPTSNTFFSGSDLLRLFAQPVRASALRDSHYYPFLVRSAPLLEWLESALLELVTNFFPTPEDPLPFLSPPQLVLSDVAPIIAPPPALDCSHLSPECQQRCQWWAPLVVQIGDLRIWLSPTNRQRAQLIDIGDIRTLEDLVFAGDIPVSCAIWARPLLHTATCRPDGSCGLQMACLITLVENSSPSFPSHQWHFQPPDKRFQFRQALANWLLSDALPDSTRAKIQGTIRWFDSGSRGLLPPEHWFSDQDIHYVLDTEWDVALWTQLGAPNWKDWSLLESTTRTLQQHDHLFPGLTYNSTCGLTVSRAVSPTPTSPRGTAHLGLAFSSRWRFSPSWRSW